ncbi:FecR domain-containing protein [Chitinophaga sp. OAE865]|uniref:FecR family protein n=1 Tax=Chitinophaga sp. OAE865 TaxID=2817898 RepID=UPI001AE8699E
MNRQEFYSLIDKWMDGSASEEEVEQLMNYYHSFKTTQEWNEAELGTKSLLEEEMEQQLLSRIRVAIPEAAPFKRTWWPKIAAAAAVLFVLSAGGWWYFQRPVAPAPVHSLQQLVATKAGEHKKIQLPDSTTVWLSPASTLAYTDAFGKENRELTLSGEAFFDVSTNAVKPFIIHSGRVTTRVLGTSFNIQAFDAQPDVAVTVLTGKVAVGNADSAVHVSPSERAVFSKATGTIRKEDGVAAAGLLSRREGILKYDRAGLPEVAAELGYYYNVKIEIKGKISNCFYFGEFNTNGTLEKALRQLCLSLNATLENNGSTYIIRMDKEC